MEAIKFPKRMWTYDLAREQTPTLSFLRKLCQITEDSGYDAIGLYLEHRFPFPSLSPAKDDPARKPYQASLSFLPEDIRQLEKEFPSITIIPMINLLGHTEGFLRSNHHQFHWPSMSEEPFKGLQACPLHSDTQHLASCILHDTIELFCSNIIHIGGDETAALGKCEKCEAKVKEYEAEGHPDGKAALYADFYRPIIDNVLSAGKTPAIWGDMLLQHPSAINSIPIETLIFDWQYFDGPSATSVTFKEKGYKVIGCPALLSYNAAWLHLPQSESNILDHAVSLENRDIDGVCLTTWEPDLLGGFETWLPAIEATGKYLNGMSQRQETNLSLISGYKGANASDWANLMGIELPKSTESFAYSKIRSSVKCRFLLYSNPFLLWLRNKDLLGAGGDRALNILSEAEKVAPNSAYRGISEAFRLAIEFTRHVEAASHLYHERRLGPAIAELGLTRQYFDHLISVATGFQIRSGGSKADIERCKAAKLHLEKVIGRLRDFGDGSLGYFPSFEHLTHPNFVPYDQGAWWLVNSWARE